MRSDTSLPTRAVIAVAVAAAPERAAAQPCKPPRDLGLWTPPGRGILLGSVDAREGRRP